MHETSADTAGRSSSGTALRYAAAFGIALLAANLSLYAWRTGGLRADPSGNLAQKMRSFSRHSADYDLVFVGDSRTYCAMHPDLIDAELGTRSINLARWAHWFPTQYAQFQDLLPRLDPDTIVVWSIGHQNFGPIAEKLGTAYPIGLGNVPFYLELGFEPTSLTGNLWFHTALLGWLPQIRSSLDARLGREIWRKGSSRGARLTVDASLQALLDRVEAHAETARWQLRVDQGANTSLEVHKKNGAYERIEIDREYFRRKQRDYAVELADQVESQAPFEASPEYWGLFLAMLDLFEEHEVRLVVNELEEAPHVYLTEERRRHLRRFMDQEVAAEVRRRGFDYVRADFDRLTDEDYFDYNHLNSRGIESYTALFARELRRGAGL